MESRNEEGFMQRGVKASGVIYNHTEKCETIERERRRPGRLMQIEEETRAVRE